MKKNFITLLVCFSFSLSSQVGAPKFINYQGLARDASGIPIQNQIVAISFTLTNGVSTPFTDSKNSTTNSFGLFNTTIGSNSNPINIDFSAGNYSLIVSINGSSLPPQLLASVPYALNAPEPLVTYTSGILTIGSTSVAISSGTNYQAGTGISIVSGSIINTAPSQSINISATNPLTVTSAPPIYSIGLTPQIFNSIGGGSVTSTYGGTFVIPTSTSSVLSGDANGPSNNNTVTAIRGLPISTITPTSGQNLVFNTGQWTPSTPIFSLSGNTIFPSTLTNGLGIGINSLNIGGSNYSVAVNGNQYLNGFLHHGGMSSMPSVAGTGNGRIYYDNTTNRYMVSEGLNAYIPLVPNNIWNKTGSSIVPTTTVDNVGIGLLTPTSKLHVNGQTRIDQPNLSDGLLISHTGSIGSAASFTSVTGNGLIASSSHSTNYGVFGINTNTSPAGYAGYFDGGLVTRSKAGASTDAFQVWNNASSPLLNVKNSGNIGINAPIPNAKLHIIENTSLNQAVALFVNNYTLTSAPSFGLRASSSNSNSTSAGVYAESLGGGNGVSGISTSTTFTGTAGVYGLAQGTHSTNVSIQADANFGNSTGLLVNSFGTHSGIGLHVKRSGTGSGIGARIENIVAGNTADAVFALTEGSGAAVHAVSSATNNASALSLLLENGHIATQGTQPTTTTPVTSSGGAVTLTTTSTDVAGKVTIIFGTGPFTAGAYANIQFTKNYTVPPIVILTPANALAATQSFFVTSNTSTFQINYTGTISSGTHIYNYYIIETK
jgi:hypothetical protein